MRLHRIKCVGASESTEHQEGVRVARMAAGQDCGHEPAHQQRGLLRKYF